MSATARERRPTRTTLTVTAKPTRRFAMVLSFICFNTVAAPMKAPGAVPPAALRRLPIVHASDASPGVMVPSMS